MLRGIEMSFHDGQVIFEQGDSAADMYFIRSGAVRIARGGVEIAVLGVDDFFGEMALFDPGPRSADAIAVGEVVLEAVDRPTLMESVEDPDVKEIIAEMSARIRSSSPEA